nr:MAG TPA: hypothetical protein [Caudoviricetes sp.]
MSWYHFDVMKFAEDMTPPLLRKSLLMALIRALLRPLVRLMREFQDLRAQSNKALLPSGQVRAIEGAIIDKYHLHSGDVYITEPEDKTLYLYYVRESAGALELPQAIYYEHENPNKTDFTIHLPDHLEKYDGDITRLIELYRPAGRKYTKQYYTYE